MTENELLAREAGWLGVHVNHRPDEREFRSVLKYLTKQRIAAIERRELPALYALNRRLRDIRDRRGRSV